MGDTMGDTILTIVNLVWDTVFTSEYCMGTASTGSYGGTIFPGGIRYSLLNNVCMGYYIHWDTGFTLTPEVNRTAKRFNLQT